MSKSTSTILKRACICLVVSAVIGLFVLGAGESGTVAAVGAIFMFLIGLIPEFLIRADDNQKKHGVSGQGQPQALCPYCSAPVNAVAANRKLHALNGSLRWVLICGQCHGKIDFA